MRRGPSRARRASGPALVRRRIFARSASPASCAALPDTNVWREADVLPASKVRSVSPTTSWNAETGRPSASAAIWVSTVVEPWPMSTAPFQKVSVPSRAERQPHGGRVGEAGVADAVPHAADADAAAPCGRRAGVERGGIGQQPLPVRPAALRGTRASPALASSTWPVWRRVAGAQRVEVAELEAVDAGFLGEIVDQRLVRDGRLRHAEAAEGAGRRVVGVDGARAVAHMRHAIRARRRAPARGPPPSAPRRRRRPC